MQSDRVTGPHRSGRATPKGGMGIRLCSVGRNVNRDDLCARRGMPKFSSGPKRG